jgi:peptidoglycan/xylan/chitin deacetylase (PgdA/CDA1 family)
LTAKRSRPARATLVALVTAALSAAALLAPDASPVAAPAEAAACPAPKSYVVKTTPATRPKTIALTFDDGPTYNTPAILNVLKRHGVKATFFVIGKHVDSQTRYGRQAVAEGHVIGNHTYSHPTPSKGGAFNKLTAKQQAYEMDQTTTRIKSKLGVTPCFFRAPGGADSGTTTLKLARARGMSVVNWTYDSQDWRSPQYASTSFQNTIYANSASTRSAHPILLMHDGGSTQYRGNTAAALDRVIRYYKARGYVFTDPNGRVLPVSRFVHAKASAYTVTAGSTVTVTGDTAGVLNGTRVYLQRWNGKAWVSVGYTTVSASNSYSLRTKLATTGVHQYRVVTGGAISKTLRVTSS